MKQKIKLLTKTLKWAPLAALIITLIKPGTPWRD